MSLSDLINVQITANTSSPSQAGYGVPLIAAYHTHYTDRARAYSSLAAMVTDGFSTTEPAYLAATVLCGQNPRPPSFKIGRRALPTTQVLTITCTDAVQGDVYSFTVAGNLVTYTVLAAATTSTVAAAIEALIVAFAIPHCTPSVATNVITLTMAAGYLIDVKQDALHTTFADVSTDPGVATDLAAIAAYDNNWYGLALDSNSSAEIQAAASWVEANTKLACYTNSDTINGSTPGTDTTSVAYKIKNSAYARSLVWFQQSQLLSYLGVGILAQRLTATPGSDNWAWKTVAGVPQDNLTETVFQNVLAKNGNVYVTLANLGTTLYGTSGSGAYADITRFVDWLTSTIQTNVFTQLVNSPKIPFTDLGVDSLITTIMGVLDQGVTAGGLVSGSYAVTAPKVATVSQANRSIRNFPSIAFTAKLQGAVDNLTITGSVST